MNENSFFLKKEYREWCRIIKKEANIQIIVDADATPVKTEIVELANQYSIKVLFVASYNHMTSNTLGCEWKYVDTDKESVDFYIMNHAKKLDIVVTQDIGLASTLLLKGVEVIHPRGKIYSESDISIALDMRYLSAKLRRGGKHTKGPKPFTEMDRIYFKENFNKILSKYAGDL